MVRVIFDRVLRKLWLELLSGAQKCFEFPKSLSSILRIANIKRAFAVEYYNGSTVYIPCFASWEILNPFPPRGSPFTSKIVWR